MKTNAKIHNETKTLRVSARLAHGRRMLSCANSKRHSCKYRNVSHGLKVSAQLAHELAHNDFNGLRVSARLKSVSARLAHGKMSCVKGSRSSRALSVRQGTPSLKGGFQRTYAGDPASNELSCPVKRKIGLARFFGTAQKFSQTDPDFLEPAKKIFGGAA